MPINTGYRPSQQLPSVGEMVFVHTADPARPQWFRARLVSQTPEQWADLKGIELSAADLTRVRWWLPASDLDTLLAAGHLAEIEVEQELRNAAP